MPMVSCVQGHRDLLHCCSPASALHSSRAPRPSQHAALWWNSPHNVPSADCSAGLPTALRIECCPTSHEPAYPVFTGPPFCPGQHFVFIHSSSIFPAGAPGTEHAVLGLECYSLCRTNIFILLGKGPAIHMLKPSLSELRSFLKPHQKISELFSVICTVKMWSPAISLNWFSSFTLFFPLA